MSLFRKRSSSQCSFSNGADEISVSKIVGPYVVARELRTDTVQSTRSSCSDVDPSDFEVHESCVVRNFPRHKSSHLRFLAWVAYTRKYTDEVITDIERRTCPLLWCREQFPDQEAMLKHVYNCSELSKGLYWCFHCQKPERVGKSLCKRCQGVPSRTDRMASVAKKIFSRLGSKAHRQEHDAVHDDAKRPFPNIRGTGRFSKPSGCHRGSMTYESGPSNWSHEYVQELPNTSICPEMAGDWTAASHELPDSYISEMTGTEVFPEMGMGNESMAVETWNDNFYTASLEDWDVEPLPAPKPRGPSPKLATLRVDTSFSSLTTSVYQGHVLHRRQPSNWIETPLSPADIISPLSAGPVFSATSIEISPTDSEDSSNTFFTDSGYSSATTTISAWNMPVMCEQPLPLASEDKRGKKRAREEDEPVFEDWIHDSAFSGQPMLTTTAEASTTNVPEPFQELTHFHAECTASENPRLFSGHWCDAPTLVHSFSEALDAHIEHTKSALRDLPSTCITQELLAMSKTSMVSIGLEVLAGILEGRKPTAIVQVFAFTHIACAFAIATEREEGRVVGQTWFRDILSWVNDLASAKQKQLYTQIARSIWKPADCVSKNKEIQVSSSRPEENALFTSCKHFLDVLESFGCMASGTKNRKKDKHLESINCDFATRVRFNDLISKSGSFAAEVVNIERRLLKGQFDGTRELELALVCAGKLAAQSETAYQDFLALVTQLCDTLYTGDSKSRTAYYMSDISLIKQLLPEESYSDDEGNDERDHVSVSGQSDEELLQDLGWDGDVHGNEGSLSGFLREADEILREEFLHSDLYDAPSRSNEHEQAILRNPSSSSSHSRASNSGPNLLAPSQSASTSTSTSSHQRSSHQQARPPPSSSPSKSPPVKEPAETEDEPISSALTSQNRHQCHCGYVPTGAEQWKASNLRRHKRTQHPTTENAKVYWCRYPGCVKGFNRSDNLKSHQREKGHGGVVLVGGERDGERGRAKGEKRRRCEES